MSINFYSLQKYIDSNNATGSFSVVGDKIIDWKVEGLAKPNTTKLKQLVSQYQTEFNLFLAQGVVADNRRTKYPPIGDQLDEILRYLETQNDKTTGLEATIEKWKAVKTEYPIEG